MSHTENERWKPSKHHLDVLWAGGGRCHICGLRINLARGDRFEIEHVIPKGLGGARRGTNERPAHVACHALKTKTDVTAIAKAKRIARKHAGLHQPRNTLTHPTLKKKVNGAVVARDTGKPIGGQT